MMFISIANSSSDSLQEEYDRGRVSHYNPISLAGNDNSSVMMKQKKNAQYMQSQSVDTNDSDSQRGRQVETCRRMVA